MAKPFFSIGQQVYIVATHCEACRDLDAKLQNPVVVRAIMPYNNVFAYRIEDAGGAHFNASEMCLCSSRAGHSSSPCVHCGQAAA